MEVFNIHNTARAQHTRMARTLAPGRAKMKQHVGGEIRVLRARPTQVSLETLTKHLEELRVKQTAGQLEVRTTDGRLVNLDDMSTATPATPPLAPHPILDSAKNDKNTGVGENLPQFPGGVPLGSVTSAAGGAGIPGTLESEHEGEPSEEVFAEGVDPVEGGELSADVDVSDPTAQKKHKKSKGHR